MRLWQEWEKTASRRPRHIAVIEAESGREFSFTEVTGRAVLMAAAMPASVQGRTLGLVTPNSLEWITAFLAGQLRGAAVLPLDPLQPAEAQEKLLRKFHAAGVWRGSQWQGEKEKKSIRGVCCWKLTSGTTGEPEGLPVQARHLIADGANIIATMKIRPSDRNLGLIPLGHSYGLGNVVMPLVMQGTAVVTAREFVPQQIRPWIERYGVTVLPAVPAVYRLLMHLPAVRKPKTWRLAISAGAVLAPEVAQEFFDRVGLKLHNFYGSSETGGICYDATGAATLSGRSVGKPLVGVRLTLGMDQRICVKSQAVVANVTRRTSRAEQQVLADLGEWTTRGELKLIGRAQPVANMGGRKVNPLEIEQALRTVPGVTDVWVGVFRDVRGRDYLGAAVETAEARKKIESVLAEKFPSWKLPRVYWLQKQLPRTGRGKLDRIKLQQAFAPA